VATEVLREAKLATDWTAPDHAYESSARRFLEAIFDRASSTLLRSEIAAFAHRIAPAGAVNGLAQVLLKLTSPGVPDIYQGTEFWEPRRSRQPTGRRLHGANGCTLGLR
jgi:(1->4)-alpha-D-glucan 1-alpha-D-glucosylmutase